MYRHVAVTSAGVRLSFLTKVCSWYMSELLIPVVSTMLLAFLSILLAVFRYAVLADP
jgi:hypothetical protein